jgi:hypothetical protein
MEQCKINGKKMAKMAKLAKLAKIANFNKLYK